MSVDAQIIAGTNADLRKKVSKGEFREDLYYRLRTVSFVIPSLRDRSEDIPVLAEYFLRRRNPSMRFSPKTMQALEHHSWPGNVRELKNAVDSAAFRATGEEIQLEHLDLEDLGFRYVDGVSKVPADKTRELLDRMRRGRSFWNVVYDPHMARDLTNEDVRQVVRAGLQEVYGNYTVLVTHFNMQPGDYKRFLNYLRRQGCHVSFQGYRGK